MDGVDVLDTVRMRDLSSRSFIRVLLAISAFAVFLEVQRMDIVSDNEGQRAAPPAEMLRSRDWVIPTINGTDYLAKPPLLYWAIAMVYSVSGAISPLTARIPTGLSCIGLVLTVYLLCRRETGETAARWAALVVLASPYVLERSRWAELDVPLTLMTFLSIMGLYRASKEESSPRAWGYALASGLALGAAIMLKGPVPLLFVGAAWVAILILRGDASDHVVRLGLRWSLGCLLLELLLKGAALLADLAARSLTVVISSDILLAAAQWLRFPFALVLATLFWLTFAWQSGGAGRVRFLGLITLGLVIGVAVATPWSVAVLMRKGWPFVQELLRTQVVERTYTASEINSGTPLYFVVGLPLMLAPWGFLLPMHFSKTEWSKRSDLYRFCVLTGWLSVLVFSLIAGKEYEYVLPAVPFLLIATGHHLTGLTEAANASWPGRLIRIWFRFVRILLPFLAIAALGYVIIKQATHQLFLFESLVLVISALVLAFLWLRRRERRLHVIFTLTLAVALVGLLSRSYYYTGSRSARELAVTCGQLVRAGHEVEASKVYPAFAFYAAVPIPINTDPEQVRQKLAGTKPYFYVTREEALRSGLAEVKKQGNPPRVLTPMYTSKRLVLIGNVPLP
ncbi:MAG: glycosyltransferase family 39 protein [Candidatus Hydrogenedentes bacterium]|nr:glycosyltransferase family 39 protein [Candidatus Hydrogenedentota bacterium]